jgi:hypothetical protein
MTIANIAACLIVLLVPTMTGCDMRGCMCHEALVIKRAVEAEKEIKELQIGHQQKGEAAVVDMKIPANMNASLCLC